MNTLIFNNPSWSVSPVTFHSRVTRKAPFSILFAMNLQFPSPDTTAFLMDIDVENVTIRGEQYIRLWECGIPVIYRAYTHYSKCFQRFSVHQLKRVDNPFCLLAA